MMPGSAAGSTWYRIVCHRVAPSAYDAWRIEFGTPRSASCVDRIITGSTTSVSVSDPAKMLWLKREHPHK